MNNISKCVTGLAFTLVATSISACGGVSEAPDDEMNQGEVAEALRNCRDPAAFVVSAYNKVLNELDKNALDTMFAKDMIQHNSTFADGSDGLAAFMEFRRTQQPEGHNEIKRVIAQGDLVALQVHVTSTAAERNDDEAGLAIVDIFRVGRGKIVEHWDVVQPVNPVSVNGNTMFDGGALYAGATRARPWEGRKSAALVVPAYDTVLNDFDPTPLQLVFDPAMIQHNPTFPNGVEPLAGFAAFRKAQQPQGHNQVERVIAQGDLVMLQVHVTTTTAERSDDHSGLAIADIFRVGDGKIVEHWDVIQQVPATSVNEHTMFDGADRGRFLP